MLSFLFFLKFITIGYVHEQALHFPCSVPQKVSVLPDKFKMPYLPFFSFVFKKTPRFYIDPFI